MSILFGVRAMGNTPRIIARNELGQAIFSAPIPAMPGDAYKCVEVLVADGHNVTTDASGVIISVPRFVPGWRLVHKIDPQTRT